MRREMSLPKNSTGGYPLLAFKFSVCSPTYPQRPVHKIPQAGTDFRVSARLRVPMDQAGNFLGGMLRQLKRPEAAVAWLSGVWPQVVGRTIAAHTRPVRCTAGCLEVATDGKPWRVQLETMQKEFCAQVNRNWGGTLVREVKFVAASRHISHEFDNDHTPFVRRRKP
jgi:predicted nucleic acid-binding Zn ribbon protein